MGPVAGENQAWRSTWRRRLPGLALAAVAPGLALGMRRLPGPDLGPPYLLFSPPILLSALVGGPWFGIVSTALSAALAATWVLGGAASPSPRDAVSLAAFLLSGSLVSLLAHLHARAGERVAAADRAAALGAARDRLEQETVVRVEQARREHETALEDRERHLRAIVETALDAFCVADGETRLLQVNDAACALLGYTRAELLTMRVADLEADEDEDETRRHAARIREDGSARFETRHRRKDGRFLDVEVAVSVVNKETGEMVCFVRDITAEKRAREALRRSEERFRALIEKSTDLIQVLDAEGRISFVSASTLEALGWLEQEVLGRPALEWVHPEDRERVAALLAGLIARPGARVRAVMRLAHRDGTWRHVEAHGRNLLEDPAVRAVVVNSRDVTEQLALEQQLRQAQRLESVGQLAGGVAHDFNNLLTVILAGAAELREPSDPQAVGEIAEEIAGAGGRARELTQQLLAFARKQVITPVALDVGEVVGGAERLLRRVLREDVALTTARAPDLWRVRADRHQLEQVILNLAVNAGDAMPRGGRLSIETANVDAPHTGEAAHHGVPPGRWVRLRVRDEGEGMAPEVRERIFEPFFTTKEKGKGTGLGLSTVYGIVTQSDGVVRVDSEPGRGSTFDVFLPAARPEQAQPAVPTAAEHPPQPGHETVLVVEDDARVRGVTVRALRSAGYRVLVAACGDEALALSASEPDAIHLLLTDMVMPGLGGRVVAERLVAARPALRVLYTSGYTRDVIDEHGVLEPGVQLLSKPFTPADLLARVRGVLDAPAPGA